MKKLLIPLMSLLWGCANVVAPTGGDKDTTPPVLVEASPPMESVQMRERTIVLRFDEYVQLKDAFNQVLISPPLEEFPDIRVKGKSIVVKLPDSLLENTTYTIQFGESIADITEGNPFSQFVYAFSTGNIIDSLYLTGTVTDVYSGKPAANTLVLLYRNLEDSAFTSQKPTYFAKTNDRGAYRISYIREGSYRVYALQDQNFNYYYDLPNESVAFLDSTLQIRTAGQTADLDLFREADQKTFISDARAISPGQVRIIFNREPDSLIITELDGASGIFIRQSPDTMYRWIAEAALDSQRIHLRSAQMDTMLTLTQKAVPEDLFKSHLETAVPPPAGGNRGRLPSQELHEPYRLTLQRPVVLKDDSRILVTADSLDQEIERIISLDTANPAILSIYSEWLPDSSYTLTLLPGALTDLFGLTNDTIIRSFRVRSPKEYGHLTVTVTDSIGEPVILQWLDKSGEVISETIPAWEDGIFLWQLNDLLPGTYHMRAVIDQDRNGKWTTGSLQKKIQPEPLLYYPAEVAIRPDWEYTVNFKLKY